MHSLDELITDKNGKNTTVQNGENRESEGNHRIPPYCKDRHKHFIILSVKNSPKKPCRGSVKNASSSCIPVGKKLRSASGPRPSPLFTLLGFHITRRGRRSTKNSFTIECIPFPSYASRLLRSLTGILDRGGGLPISLHIPPLIAPRSTYCHGLLSAARGCGRP